MSEPTYTNDGIYIVKALLQHLNSWDEKPCKINLEAFDKNAPSMMMQQLSGTVKKREYVNGAYIGALPFQRLIRIILRGLMSRLVLFAYITEILQKKRYSKITNMNSH